MSKFQRSRYTLELKLEAVRLTRSGWSIRRLHTPGGAEQALRGIEVHAQGQLEEAGGAGRYRADEDQPAAQ